MKRFALICAALVGLSGTAVSCGVSDAILFVNGEADTLTIHGGNDDTVTVSGAVNTDNTQTIDGQTYNVYTIGNDGATLVIDQDVNVII